MTGKTALITGVTGQDGSYLAELLLSKTDEYNKVLGLVRRSSINNKERVEHLFENDRFDVIEGDITDACSINSIVSRIKPDEIYNLAAQSVVEDSLLPIKSAQKIEYRTFKSLWDEIYKKNPNIRYEGHVEVIDIPNNKQLKALGYWNGMGTWFAIKQISRHRWNDKVAKIKQKFGSVTVTPNHCLLDVNQQICKAEDNKWLLNVRNINYDGSDIKLISTKNYGIDTGEWFHKAESGKIGKVKALIEESMFDQLCTFIGAFVSEGHTAYNKANDTYTVNISEQSKEWLEDIQQKIKCFCDGRSCIIKHKKEGYEDVYSLEVKSRYLYDLMRKWCGKDSYSKSLPHWFSELPVQYMKVLFNNLIKGDGCYNENGTWRYTTSSYKLACQLGWLFTRLGYQYTIHTEYNEKYQKEYYHFRECRSYQPNQGTKTVEYIDYDGYVYDITVDEVSNFTVGIGNIVVHNSHVGTSFEQPIYTFRVDAEGVLNILEAVRCNHPYAKIYQASTSEMFGSNISLDYDIQGSSAHYNGPPLDKDNMIYQNRDGMTTTEPQFENDGIYQDEDTPLDSQSPYATAKIAAHNLIDLYRKSYGLFASCGVLFNHETLTYGTPLIFRKDGLINILPIGDIARFHTGIVFNMDGDYQSGCPIHNIEVWDYNGWTKVKYVSGYPHKFDKNPRIVNSRNSTYIATSNHICILEDGSEKSIKDLNVGDNIKLIDLPQNNVLLDDITIDEAEFLGMLVGDGSLSKKLPRLCNKSMKIKERFIELWKNITKDGTAKHGKSKSGFTGGDIGYVICYSDTYDFSRLDIYTSDISVYGHKNKKVPMSILNSDKKIMEAFLVGYNTCDGLKKNKCNYRFKNFNTNSQTLACGLIYLIYHVTGQKYNITVQENSRFGKQQFQYFINLLSDNESPYEKYIRLKPYLNMNLSIRDMHKKTGLSQSFIRKVVRGYIPSLTHYLYKKQSEIKKIIDIPDYQGWFFDLETESGTFHAGAGQGLIHNSPRRGEHFVTRKITRWIGQAMQWSSMQPSYTPKFGGGIEPFFIPEAPPDHIWNMDCDNPKYFPKLRLGNLDAYRDWGHAKDYVRAMYMILQQDVPDDFVIGTGETHNIRDFLSAAFKCIDIDDWTPFVVQDKKYMRPAEVDYLCSRPQKAKDVLGWQSEISFEELVKEMVENDIALAKSREKL